MTSESMKENIVEMVEENGNRMRMEDAVEELSSRTKAITFNEAAAERSIKETIDEKDTLVKDRFGGHDQIEKVVY